ncbi:spermatogenesis-associated protein 2-like, partial [Clarias magur]
LCCLFTHTHARNTHAMTNISGGETAKAGHQDVLERYVSFYSRVWSEGGVRVCEDTQLMEQARQVLLTPGQEAHTFTLLPFYPTVIDIISSASTPSSTSNTTSSTSSTSISSVLQHLSKAFEVLELFCINLFLFPWRKEIKILK